MVRSRGKFGNRLGLANKALMRRLQYSSVS